MKSTNIMIFAVILAVVGTWAEKKHLEQKQVVGGVVAIFFFMFLSNAQPKLAQTFSWLLLTTVIGAYGKDLFGTIGTVTGATATAAKDTAKTVAPRVGK